MATYSTTSRLLPGQAVHQSSWSWLLRNVVLPAGDLAFGQSLVARLRFLEEAQWWDRERILAHRDRALGELVTIAYEEVPFYRRVMEQSGLTPSDVRCREDLHKFPVVTKQMLLSGYPASTTRSTGQKTHEASSSGSTGTNFRVKEDARTESLHRACFLLALGWSGWIIGDAHLQTGITLKRSVDRRLKDLVLRCHYVSAFDLSDAHLDEALDVLERHGIQHVWGYPGSLYCLSQRARTRGWNRPLKSIVTWGDNLYPHYRRSIEAAFGARIIDTYGCGEGIQIAAQCGSGNTYHIHTPDVILDCLDETGRPVSPGETGNLVVTRLHPGPMPLIRYQVGDVGVLGGARLCECGRGYEIMESIQGRDTDMVLTPSGNRLIVHFFTGIFEYFPEIHSFQVLQEEVESILIRIVPTDRFSTDTAQRLVSQLQVRGASDLKVEIETVAEIPPTVSGKRRFVIAKPFRKLAEVQQDLEHRPS